ncbi:MAG: hypothetical protein K0R22_2918 [Sporomusa sp.]|jgi:hypothetical protein|nr:hypothetical protein [Sporomusa sp.]
MHNGKLYIDNDNYSLSASSLNTIFKRMTLLIGG